MVSELLALLSTAKGAATVSVVIAAAVGTSVAATSAGVQKAVDSTVQNLTLSSEAKSLNRSAIVTARNDADQKLRDAFQSEQQKLNRLHSTQVDSADRARFTDTINSGYAALRARVNRAFNDIEALTLGRYGLQSKGKGPDVTVRFTADAQAKVDATVEAAIKDMDKIVGDAATAVAAPSRFSPSNVKQATVPTLQPAYALDE